MSRLNLTDTAADAMMKMCDGNPGAIAAMGALVLQAEEIDPENVLGPTAPLHMLDDYEIYGTAIYVLFSDKCGKDVRKMIMLLRATQMGMFSQTKLQAMAADQRREVEITDDEWAQMDKDVCEQLVGFLSPQRFADINEQAMRDAEG